MSVFKLFMHFRLNIDAEYQGWILAFATLTAIWVYCLPCYCAGMQLTIARRYAAWIQMRLPYFLAVATVFNIGMMFLVITWLPDWGPGDYVKCMLMAALYLAKNAMKFMTSIAFIVIFVFVVAFKDRFLKLAGVDHKTVFRFKLRDIFGGTTRAIAVDIWKVDDLPAAQVFAPNNIFIEMYLGYNEPMKTRVHNNAGSSCILKESLQLNFDENEDEEPLYLFVKNQKVMGAGELGRLELKAEDVFAVEKECAARRANGGSGLWAPEHFVEKRLMPRGTIWIRVLPVDDEEKMNMVC
jgi:hypothetical protein